MIIKESKYLELYSEKQPVPLLAGTKRKFRLCLCPQLCVTQLWSTGLPVTEHCKQMLCREPLATVTGHNSRGRLVGTLTFPVVSHASIYICIHVCMHTQSLRDHSER